MRNPVLNASLLLSCAAVFWLAEAALPAFAEGTTIETVVVTSRRQATTTKRDASVILDATSVQAIRSLPDVNAAEALQRIPGISMESDTGEGRFINIRGMDADLNGTTYDGVKLTASNPATPQGGARAVAFDAFPAGILGGIEVIKTMNPEMDAEGLGGVINIVPRTVPAGEDYIVDASLGTGLTPLRNNPVWDGSLTAGKRFGLWSDDDRFTIVASYAYHEDWRGIDDLEEDYANDPALPAKTFQDLNLRWYRYHRTRQGYGGGLTYELDNDSNVYIRGFHAGYTEIAHKQYLHINNLGTGSVTGTSPNGDIAVNMAEPEVDITDTREDVGNNMIEAGGNTLLAGFIKADIRASWTLGTDSFPLGDGFSFADPNPVSLVYNNTDPRFPQFHTTDGTDLQDPTTYSVFSGSNGLSKNRDQEWAGKGDLQFPLPIAGYDGTFAFGLSARLRQTQASSSNSSFLPIPATDTYANFSIAGFPRIYYQTNYNIGDAVIFSALQALPQGPQVPSPTSFQDNNENVYATYGQYEGTFGALDVVAGLRVEATQGTYRANIQDANTGVLTPSVGKHDYTNFFPDLNVKYQVTDDFLVRAAYSSAIARPGFNQITAAKSVDLINLILTEGDPSLKPTTGQGVDLSAEYYDETGGIASVALFQKWFSNYIIPTELLGVNNVPNPEFPTAGPPTLNNVQIDSFSNIGSAQTNGIELNLSKQFTFLPEGWDGLGVDANATFVGSRGQIRTGEVHTLPQTSPINWNASVFYQEGPFNLRLAWAYVSRNIFGVGSSDATDVYSQPRLRLDFGGSYNITDQIQYYLDIKNLSNTKLEFTQTADKNFPIQREFYDATYLTGIRIELEP